MLEIKAMIVIERDDVYRKTSNESRVPDASPVVSVICSNKILYY